MIDEHIQINWHIRNITLQFSFILVGGGMVIHKELNDSCVLTVPLIIFCKKKKNTEKYAIAK